MDRSDWLNEHGLGALTVNTFGERFFFNLNRHAFDKLSAHAQFDRRYAETLFRDDTLTIVIGTDSGLLPGYLRGKGLPKGSRYVFIEPGHVLQVLQAHGLLDESDERIVCVDAQDWPQAIQRFKIADYCYIDGVKSLNAMCAEDDFINEYAELSWHVTEVLSQLHWQYSIQLGSEAFISRQIHNIADNRLPAKILQNTFVGQTAVLLAGGPSLDQILPWVRQHRDIIVVMAVSRIARQLIAADIQPDFVFSVDPTELSFDISKEMLQFSERTVFVCSHHVVPTLLSQWLGRVLYLGDRVPWLSELNVPNLHSVGPTVTNTALSVAHAFGFKRVILAGVDLCFTREGFTHAKGSNEQLAGPRFNLTSLQVETNAGFMAPTSCDFVQAIQSLAVQARVLSASGCELINVAEGAAKIDAIAYQALGDIQLDDDVLDVSECINRQLPMTWDVQADALRVQHELRRARFQVSAIARLAKRARRINDEMYVSQQTVVNFKDKKQLDLIEKRFKREYRHFNQLVKKFGIRRLIKLAKPFNDDEWSAEEARQLGDVYYEAYAEGANRLLILLDEAFDRVMARLIENTAALADFDSLFAQCERDRSFGRVRLWRKKYASLTVSETVLQRFDDFEQRFQQILDDKNTRHFASAKGNSNLAQVKQRAGLLFKHKKCEELQDLLLALDKHDEQQAASVYRYLIVGYLSELSGQHEAAFEAYQKIVDQGEGLLEEALTRIAALGLDGQDTQIAHLALQCLSQLNPYYLPLYAEILRLQGDGIAAIDVYSAYIEQFPSDLLVQMKLATLYVDRGVYDGAEMMLDFILQQKGDFTPALSLKQQLSQRRLPS